MAEKPFELRLVKQQLEFGIHGIPAIERRYAVFLSACFRANATLNEVSVETGSQVATRARLIADNIEDFLIRKSELQFTTLQENVRAIISEIPRSSTTHRGALICRHVAMDSVLVTERLLCMIRDSSWQEGISLLADTIITVQTFLGDQRRAYHGGGHPLLDEEVSLIGRSISRFSSARSLCDTIELEGDDARALGGLAERLARLRSVKKSSGGQSSLL